MARTLIDLGVLDNKLASRYYGEARRSGKIAETSGGFMPCGLRDDYGWLLINLGGFEAEAGHWDDARGDSTKREDLRHAGAGHRSAGGPAHQSLAWSLHDLGRYEVRR